MAEDYKRYFLEGVAHFNNREFWEAHESWETIWLVAETDVEQFLQGLIQLAAAYHHIKRGNVHGGAARLFEAALRRLAPFPQGFSGVDRAPAESAARRHQAWVGARLRGEDAAESFSPEDFPRLELLDDAEVNLPPRTPW